MSGGDVRVFIYDAASGGNLVYDSVGDFNGTIVRGIVDVMLGSGSQNLDLNYGNYYYMDINITPSSSTTPVNLDFNGVNRKQFESNRGNDLNISSLGRNGAIANRIGATAGGNFGVGTNTPQNKVNVLGDLNVVAAAGTGAPLFYVNATKAGFGTVVPNNAATIVGDLNVIASNTTSVPSLYITTSGLVGVNMLASPTYTVDVNGTFRVQSGGTLGLFQNSSGNVGIGTITPGNKLNVVGDGNVTGDLTVDSGTLFLNSSTNRVGVGTLTPGNTLNVVGDFNVTGTSYLGNVILAASDLNVNNVNTRDGNINFVSSSGSSIVKLVGSSGFVGVGTVNPRQALNVVGDFNVTGTSYLGNVILNTNDINVTNVNARTSDIVFVSNTGSEIVRMASDGNVSIGNSGASSKNKFAVVGDFNVSPAGLSAPSIYVRATDGNVGIGTNNPIRKLSVVGDVNVLGTVYATAFNPSNQWAVSGSSIYYTAGNVGINTSTPGSKLNLLGDINVSITAGTGNPSLLITADGNVGINSIISKNKLLLVGDLNVVTAGNAVPSLFVNSVDGNVAIGAASSSSRLTVKGMGTNASSVSFKVTNSSDNSRLLIRDDGNISIGSEFTLNKLAVVGDLNVTPTGVTSGPALFVHPTDGNVGIGTVASSPYRLDVSGQAKVSGYANFGGDVNITKKLGLQDLNLSGKTYVRESPAGNACMGTAQLADTGPGAGVTVSTTCVTANSRVFLTRYGGVGNTAVMYWTASRVAGTSFDINSSLDADTNNVAWMIIEPA